MDEEEVYYFDPPRLVQPGVDNIDVIYPSLLSALMEVIVPANLGDEKAREFISNWWASVVENPTYEMPTLI